MSAIAVCNGAVRVRREVSAVVAAAPIRSWITGAAAPAAVLLAEIRHRKHDFALNPNEGIKTLLFVRYASDVPGDWFATDAFSLRAKTSPLEFL
jgi:hypothetical protein